VGLWFLANPIIGLIYEHGHFLATDTLQTGYALQFYALGLVSYSCIKVLSPAFYAINRKWTPMLVSFGTVALNLILNYVFMFKLGLGHKGLALSTTICATLNFILLYVLMLTPASGLETGKLFSTIARCLLATLPIALVCNASVNYGPAILPGNRLVSGSILILITLVLSTGVYIGACMVMKVEETTEALAVLKRKLKR